MKSQPKKIQNINLLQTQSTLTEIVESKVKVISSFTKKQPKPFMTVSSLQNQKESAQIKRKSGIVIDFNQMLQINHEIEQQNEEILSQMIDCPHIQPICKKEMSKSSCNELEDINFSHIEINLAGAQHSSPQVACNPLQQNNLYVQVFKSEQQVNKYSKETSLQRYYKRFYKKSQHRKWNKSAPDQSIYKNIQNDRNPQNMQNPSNKQVRAYQLRVIQPLNNTKKSFVAQNQLSMLHSKELNYCKAKNSLKLKDYLYQTQLSSKIKMHKRKEAHQRKKIEKKHLVSSFSNSQAPLNPLKRKNEKQKKYSVKSSEILQIVKSQILSELKECTQTIKKISEEIKQVQSWLQVPKDQDLWRIFELKRNIQQRMSVKLINALQDLRVKKDGLQKRQRK